MRWLDPVMCWPLEMAEVEIYIDEFPGLVKGYYQSGKWFDSWHRRIEPLRWRYGRQLEGVVEYREAHDIIEWAKRGGEV